MKTARPNDTTRANSFTTAPRNRVITDRDLSDIIGFAHPAMLRSLIRRNVAGLALRGSCRPTEQSGFHLNQSQALYLVSVAPLPQKDPNLIAAVSRAFRAEA
ncbi:hypothetical protein AD940_01865 [Gluconobacter thailandicus]|nr:hypothetical protein AD940_01865 [Gluconobacter thailandicus]